MQTGVPESCQAEYEDGLSWSDLHANGYQVASSRRAFRAQMLLLGSKYVCLFQSGFKILCDCIEV